MKKSFSPREFLEARRPEQFSDTIQEEEAPPLDRSMLEYHLGSLTNRGEENPFAEFARLLAQKEICPNLLPQTGPTGGGDSKVDSETFPVADQLSMVWYQGIGREAASERWAFAFSAKKAWQDKVKSDIEKIVKTGRGYVKGFFVTNQYVPDKKRAALEDDLKLKHGLEVRILDLTWILDKVFTNHHEALAIEALRMAISPRKQSKPGPQDLQRQRHLEEVEARIQAEIQLGKPGGLLVDDCIKAATLARGLGRPRTEVDGLFARSQRVAKEYGTQHQQLVAIYDCAWTAYWWHEDYKLLADLYAAAETLVEGSQNAYELELLSNLWKCLRTATGMGKIDGAALPPRTEKLMAELERLSKEEGHPSASLQARTLLLTTRLQTALLENGEIDPILLELQEIVRECDGLIGYPFEPLVGIVSELGQFLGNRPAYEQLFETITQAASKRKGDVTAARMLVTRGAQQLTAERPYEAICSLGRALSRLYTNESRQDATYALYLIGCAYERVGLLWAARGATLCGASIAAREFLTHGEATPQQAICLKRLKWLEIQHGRLPHVLAWHEVHQAVWSKLIPGGYTAMKDADFEDEARFNGVLGLLFLKAELEQIKELARIPDILDYLDLHGSASALRFALGHNAELPEKISKSGDDDAARQFFTQWCDQPASHELKGRLKTGRADSLTLVSHVLGCRITVDSQNIHPCIELAESLLAVIESLLSTGIHQQIVAREPLLTFKICLSDSGASPFSFSLIEHDGRPHFDVKCREFSPHCMSSEKQKEIKEKLFELVATVLASTFRFGDLDETLTTLIRDELALERSINFTSSFVTMANILGPSPKVKLSDWEYPNAREYPLTRPHLWDHGVKASGSQASSSSDNNPALGETRTDPRDVEKMRHTQIATLSLIREPLWNRADWSGVGFIGKLDGSELPIMALIFKNEALARQIFSQWRTELGAEDVKELLRVTIIRGISKTNPSAYRIVLGVNPEATLSVGDIQQIAMVSRMHTMEPISSQNSDAFLTSHVNAGKYILACGVLANNSNQIKLLLENQIRKTQLNVRDAWRIGVNDLDSAGIREDDDPIVPSDNDAAPVLELLQLKKSRGRNL